MLKKTKIIIKKSQRLLLSPFLLSDYVKFRKKADKRFSLSFLDVYPCLFDKTIKTGFDSHYIYHTAWAARKVRDIGQDKHVDISSSLYFSGIISAFMKVDFYDYRPAELRLSNLKTDHCDLVKLAFESNSIKSLSCMHSVEHIGLGRYGDSIDPGGDLKSMKELSRVLAFEGSLLFVVPVGRPKIEYNAHRVYTYEMIIDAFKDLSLKEFSMIDDAGNFIEMADSSVVKNQNYACGCFHFKKETK